MSGQSYEIVSTVNLDDLKTAYKVFYYRMNKVRRISGTVLGLFFISYSIFMLFYYILLPNPRPPIVSVYTGLIMLLMLTGVACIFRPSIWSNITAHKVYSNTIKLKLPMQVTKIISDTGIESKTEQSTSIIKWEQVEKSYLINNCAILYNKQMILILNFNDVTNGTPDELLQFLRSKITLKKF